MNSHIESRTTQIRLAQYYVRRLQFAVKAVMRGYESHADGLRAFDNDWLQISQWQAWSARHAVEDSDAARLCIQFALVGAEIFAIRQHPREYAQSLQAALSAALRLQDKKSECALYFYLYLTHSRMNALETAQRFAIQLFDLSREIGDDLHYGRALYALGQIAQEHGDYNEADRLHLQSHKVFEALDARHEMGRSLSSLGLSALFRGDYSRAYAYFSRYLQLAEVMGQQSQIAVALLLLGETTVRRGNLAEAKEHIERSVSISRSLEYRRILSASLTGLGDCLIESGDLDAGCAHLLEALDIAREIANQRNLIQTLSSLGYVHFRLKKHAVALQYLQEGLTLARRAGQLRLVCDMLRNRVYTRVALDDVSISLAQEELSEALAIAQTLNSEYQKVRMLLAAMMLWQHKGRFAQSARWAGLIASSPHLDTNIFAYLCNILEGVLGPAEFNKMQLEGKALTLDIEVASLVQYSDGVSSLKSGKHV